MKVDIEITEKELKALIWNHLAEKLGDSACLDEKKISIMVKSKQNYRSEWEPANFKATYKGEI